MCVCVYVCVCAQMCVHVCVCVLGVADGHGRTKIAAASGSSADAAAGGTDREAFAVDVYSMAIMMWEVFSDAELYGNVSDRDLADHVIAGGRCAGCWSNGTA